MRNLRKIHQIHGHSFALIALIGVVVCGLAMAYHPSQADTATPAAPAIDIAARNAALLAKATTDGSVRVIVGVRAPFSAAATRATIKAGQSSVQNARTAVLASLSNYKVTVSRNNWVIPYMALTVDKGALQALIASPDVTSIDEDHELKATDTGSDALIGAPTAWARSAYGTNAAVVIIDTGVQENHPFLGGRIVAESCFSTTDLSGATNHYYSNCPNGLASQQGAGAGTNCLYLSQGCEHGTHVAGIAAGNGIYSGGVGYAGVAVGANIIPIQVFSTVTDSSGSTVTGESAFDSDIISGLNQTYTFSASFVIGAVNMSLGNSFISDVACDSYQSGMTTAISLLYNTKIPVAIASGNGLSTSGISYPACISQAISVGAVGDGTGTGSSGDSNAIDVPAYFSNVGHNLSLLAPGVNILSSVPGSSYQSLDGTSMATPHVAGALAVLRAKLPGATVASLLQILRNSGKPILDTRSGVNITTPRIQLNLAINTITRHKYVGSYDPVKGIFYLRNSNMNGPVSTVIRYGPNGNTALPIVGDWAGSGTDTIGAYDQTHGQFLLRYSNSPGPADKVFNLGIPGDTPLAGDWIGQGHDGAGVFRPTNGILYLKNALTTGFADYFLVLGNPGDIGISEDWDTNGIDSPGVYRPNLAKFYLSNKVTNGVVFGDVAFVYGTTYNRPLVGDWSGTGRVGIGIFDPGTGVFSLRNTLTPGAADTATVFGSASWLPIVGHWTVAGPSLQPDNLIVPSVPAVTPPAPIAPPSTLPTDPGSFDG